MHCTKVLYFCVYFWYYGNLLQYKFWQNLRTFWRIFVLPEILMVSNLLHLEGLPPRTVCFSPFLSVLVSFGPFLNISERFFLFLSVSVCFFPFLSFSVRCCLFLSVSVCYCLFFKCFSPFLSVSVCFILFLSVSVRLGFFKYGREYLHIARDSVSPVWGGPASQPQSNLSC